MSSHSRLTQATGTGLAIALLSGYLATISLPATAEVIEVPVAQQAADMQSVERPLTGSHRDHVLEKFGQPVSSTPAVGDPPISRWEYTDFYVYFEYDHVIHSVMKHRPKNLDN